MTLTALCLGLSAILFAMGDQWRTAVAMLMLAGFADHIDGRLARRLSVGSPIGVELDSLSDFVCFGVAPPLLLYLWSLSSASGGWLVASFGVAALYVICAALRLARFNVMTHDSAAAGGDDGRAYFVGLSTPAAAAVCLLPMTAAFAFSGGETLRSPLLVMVFLLLAALLMISRVPTWSLKTLPPAGRYALLGSFAAILFCSLFYFVSLPWRSAGEAMWLAAFLAVVLYAASIPLSATLYARRRRRRPSP